MMSGNESGKIVTETGARGFDQAAKQKIREYIYLQKPEKQNLEPPTQRLELYQKYHQNGMYERSQESGTEANYDMVDGQVNNQKRSIENMKKQESKRPKKRTSVIKKFHEKQIAIAKRSPLSYI